MEKWETIKHTETQIWQTTSDNKTCQLHKLIGHHQTVGISSERASMDFAVHKDASLGIKAGNLIGVSKLIQECAGKGGSREEQRRGVETKSYTRAQLCVKQGQPVCLCDRCAVWSVFLYLLIKSFLNYFPGFSHCSMFVACCVCLCCRSQCQLLVKPVYEWMKFGDIFWSFPQLQPVVSATGANGSL